MIVWNLHSMIKQWKSEDKYYTSQVISSVRFSLSVVLRIFAQQRVAQTLCDPMNCQTPGSSDGKPSAYNAGDPIRSLRWEDPLEKEMAIHSSIHARQIPRSEEPGGGVPTVHGVSKSRTWLSDFSSALQTSKSITNSWSLPKSMSIDLVIPSSHLILCHLLLLLPPIFPSLGSFPGSQLFTWGGQSIGVSASTSVLPMKTQGWSPLGWTNWIFLQSKWFSRVFSNTTVQKCQFFHAQLSSPSNTHIHTWLL